METSVHYTDPQGVLAFFLALAFVIYCCGCYIYGYLNRDVKPLFHKFNEENASLLNGFGISHVDDLPTVVREAPIFVKEVSIVQEVKKNNQDDRLLQDCVAVLVSLGAKKGEAKTIATDFLKHHPEVETVEQFIKEHYGH